MVSYSNEVLTEEDGLFVVESNNSGVTVTNKETDEIIYEDYFEDYKEENGSEVDDDTVMKMHNRAVRALMDLH